MGYSLLLKIENLVFWAGRRSRRWGSEMIGSAIDQICSWFQGVRVHVSVNTETLYETTPKLHSILMIKQAASMAWIKQRTAACDELSRVE